MTKNSRASVSLKNFGQKKPVFDGQFRFPYNKKPLEGLGSRQGTGKVALMTIPDQDGSLFLSSSASVSEGGSFSSLAWPMLSPKAVIFPGMLSKKVLNLAVFRPISSACNLLVIDLLQKHLNLRGSTTLQRSWGINRKAMITFFHLLPSPSRTLRDV